MQNSRYHLSLKRYIEAFNMLNADNYRAALSKILAEEVYFQDPFHRIHGKQNTLALFEHMFAQLHQPQFKVLNAAISEISTDTPNALLHWHFEFALRADAAKICFQGMSRITFNPDGLIDSHIDFWDAGTEVYAKVPLLGWLIRRVQRRLSLPENKLMTD